jgi:hypothetical protein
MVIGIALLGVGAVLLALAIALGTRPALQLVAIGLRVAVPYVLLLGLGLLTVYGVLRRQTDESFRRPHEPTLFGKDSTDFVSLDRGASDDPTLPAQRGPRPPSGAAGPPNPG